MDDHNLLTKYAIEGSEGAFEELIRKYSSLVYSSAIRRVGPNHAEDITQAVFMILARKADSLAKRRMKSLAGWLFRTTRFAASEALRSQARRERREQVANEEQTQLEEEMTSAPSWDAIRPLLDAALDKLGHKDREALLLRYYQEASYADVGEILGLSENAATKRVARATDKLQALLAKKGMALPGAALAALLTAHVAEAAPAGVITAGAAVLTKGTASAVLIAEGAAKSMFLYQVKTAVVAGCALVATGAGTVTAISSVLTSPFDPSRHVRVERVEVLPLIYMARSRFPDNSEKFQLNSTRNNRTHFAKIGDTLFGYRLARHHLMIVPTILPGTSEPIPVDTSVLVFEKDGRETQLRMRSKDALNGHVALLTVTPDGDTQRVASGDTIMISEIPYEIAHVDVDEQSVRLRHVDSRQEFVVTGKK